MMRSISRAASIGFLMLTASTTGCSSGTTPMDGGSDVLAADTQDVAMDVPTSPDSQTDAGADTADVAPMVDVPSDTTAADGGVDRARLEGLIAQVADALCSALYRCCDDNNSRMRFFGPMIASERLVSLRSRIPADGMLPQAMCAPLLRDIYAITPLGDWVRAALDGRVAFNAMEADRCLATLASATCGADVANALTDGTCFGFSAPAGGTQQRRMFSRSSNNGDACVAIADGVGSTFFGTCDPTESFCCARNAMGRCVPATTMPGTCQPASQIGESCSFAPEFRICATGLECNDMDRCEAPRTAPLMLGQTCAMGFTLLGECQASWCDLGGTNRCEALRADMAMCTFGYECQSGNCVSMRCAPETFCRR